MAKFDKSAKRNSYICCRNCRKLYRDTKDGKYRCAITHGQVFPNSICEQCLDATIAVTIEDLLPVVDEEYYKTIYKSRKRNYNSE